MPRTRKTNGRPTDYTAQPIQTPTGQPYGQATKLANAQKAVPLPNAETDVRQQVQQVAQEWDPFSGVTPMSAPSEHIQEPVTAGLSSGPGAGPEVLRRMASTGISDTLRLLAQASEDPILSQLADRTLPS